MARTASPVSRGIIRRDDGAAPLIQVLLPVVVELPSRDDLAHDRRLRLVVAEHRDLELPRVDPFSRRGSGSRIVPRRDGRVEIAQVRELRDPDG